MKLRNKVMAAVAGLALAGAVLAPAAPQAAEPAVAATGQHFVTMRCAQGQKAVIKVVTYKHIVTLTGFSVANGSIIGQKWFYPRFTGEPVIHPYFGWGWTYTRFALYSSGMYTYVGSCAWI